MENDFTMSEKALHALFSFAAKKEILTFLKDKLESQFGTSPSVDELRAFYMDDADIGLNSEQIHFLTLSLLEYVRQSSFTVENLLKYQQETAADIVSSMDDYLELHFPEEDF